MSEVKKSNSSVARPAGTSHLVGKDASGQGGLLKTDRHAFQLGHSDSRLTVVSGYFLRMKQSWKTWPGTSSGLPSPGKEQYLAERQRLLPGERRNRGGKVFDALEWLRHVFHILQGEQMVRY